MTEQPMSAMRRQASEKEPIKIIKPTPESKTEDKEKDEKDEKKQGK